MGLCVYVRQSDESEAGSFWEWMERQKQAKVNAVALLQTITVVVSAESHRSPQSLNHSFWTVLYPVISFLVILLLTKLFCCFVAVRGSSSVRRTSCRWTMPRYDYHSHNTHVIKHKTKMWHSGALRSVTILTHVEQVDVYHPRVENTQTIAEVVETFCG